MRIDLQGTEVHGTRATLLAVLANRGMAVGGLPLVVLALARLDSRRMAPVARGRGARSICSSMWHGGVGVALHNMAARRGAKRRVWWLGVTNRGEWGVSEVKDALLPCSMAARIRVPRRVHMGQWRLAVYGGCRVTRHGVTGAC
jgi:hypothetical protein